jgi:conjugative relaxase-like TrwC/TraI family protein
MVRVSNTAVEPGDVAVLVISPPVSAVQMRRYHADALANPANELDNARIRGAWHGKLADHFGLAGAVDGVRYRRLAEGQDPITGETLVRRSGRRRFTNARGQTLTSMSHRAGWDATFCAPKSASLTALVGRDLRVRESHCIAVAAALHELEPFVQAHCRGNRPRESTGNWVAAVFEHDSARPVNGYAAPHLHSHVVIFNLTRTARGEICPLESLELFRSRAYVTAVYRSVFARSVRQLGYEVEHGRWGQPEIHGYSDAYLEASSPRHKQIEAYLRAHVRRGAVAAQMALLRTRTSKHDGALDEMQQHHEVLAKAFGHQPAQVVDAARRRGCRLDAPPRISAALAVAYAESRANTRSSGQPSHNGRWPTGTDERQFLGDALRLSMGEVPLHELRMEVQRRIDTGELYAVWPLSGGPRRALATRDMIEGPRARVAWEPNAVTPTTDEWGSSQDVLAHHIPVAEARPPSQEQGFGLGL